MAVLLLDWITLVLRWSHVLAAIAWIGSSFYFVALDFSLRGGAEPEAGVAGEAWQVHGGGFYRIRKYLVAPASLPSELTWFMWEAYSTWLLGFGLLVLEYYLKPGVYLIDPAVMTLPPWAAVAVGLASLAGGWIVYDLLCRSPIGRNSRLLSGLGLVLLFAASAAYLNVFSARGAYLHVGALVGTIMVANVFFIIIPNQRKIVAALLAGETPSADLGKQSKERSLHNNYLTLPVVFVMLSSHYPFTFAGPHPLLVLTAVFVVGFLVRHHFNLTHKTGSAPKFLFPAAARSSWAWPCSPRQRQIQRPVTAWRASPWSAASSPSVARPATHRCRLTPASMSRRLASPMTRMRTSSATPPAFTNKSW